MTTTRCQVSADDVGRAWAEAFTHVLACRGREAVPLSVTIATDDGVSDDPSIREIADRHLGRYKKAPIGTVASTIFPRSLWREDRPAVELFARYARIWPMVRKNHANRHGTYFRRFTAFGGGDPPINQIEHVLTTWERGNHRRSALQLAVFDPSEDHTHQRQRGFPCLHQVALVPDGERLHLTAFYATQVVFEKAYGNYLGLAYLGEFMSQEMGLSLASVTCVAAVAKLTQVREMKKSQRENLREELAAALEVVP